MAGNLGVGVTHIDEISLKLKQVADNVQRRRKGTFIIDQTFISLMWIPKSEIGQYEIDISSRRQLLDLDHTLRRVNVWKFTQVVI